MFVIRAVCVWLSRIYFVAASFALIAMMLHVGADVFGKYVFNHPIPGTIEVVAWYYMVAVAFLPIGYVQLRREHLMVEMFTMNMPRRGQAALDALVATGGVVYCGLLAWLVYLNAVKATKRGEFQDVSLFDLPVWPAWWILPAAFSLMALVFMVQFIDDLRLALTGRSPSAIGSKSTAASSDIRG